jgi:hypothetical protein
MGSMGGGGSMGGAGGSGGCVTCYQASRACIIASCPQDSQLCSASAFAYQALKTCMCGYCSGDCNQTCNNMGVDAPSCQQCIQDFVPTVCSAEFQVCVVN